MSTSRTWSSAWKRWIDNPFMGDMPFEAVYSDYKDVGGGVQFPMHIVQQQGGYPDLRPDA